MIIRNITGDVTAPIKGIIGHGVNCQGVMGSGVALAIRNKFPKVYTEYLALCARTKPEDLLGTTQLVKITDDLYVANMFTQLNFGGDGKVYASLDAVRSACSALTFQREELIQTRQQGNFHQMLEAVLEVYMDNEMSPRQKYEPMVPFFADVDGCGKDRVTGDHRRQAIVAHLRAIAVQSQNAYKSDDFNQCIYDLEIFLPRIAAGLGGLEWEDVKKAVNSHTGLAPVSIYTQ